MADVLNKVYECIHHTVSDQIEVAMTQSEK